MGTLQARASSGGVGSGAQMNAVLSFQPGFVARGEGPRPSTEVFPTLGAGTTGDQAPHVLAFDAYNQQVTGEVSKTLGVGSDYSHVPIAFGLELANNGSGGNRGYTNPGEPMPTIGTGRPHGVVSASIDKQTGLVSENVSPTLKTDLAHQMGPVVATYEWHGQDSRVREIDVAASLNRNAEGREGHLVLEVAPVAGVDGERNPVREGVIGPLNTGSPSGGGQHPIVVATPVTAFKIRGGVDVDSAGKQAGKGYLGSEEMALTLGTTQDQHLFDTRITPTVMSSGQAKAELTQDKSPSLTTLQEAPILFPTLDASEGRKWGSDQWINNGKCVHMHGVPRRLTPVECERLMGWPDGWTDVADDKGRPAPDTARYKACGNGVASPVSAWIGFQLAAAITKDTL